ncbi:MAG TPA: hypothetical protein VFA89_03065 [Terriglobales bacterium]|nr:hypothetical protein [Terriglobales bacterium]
MTPDELARTFEQFLSGSRDALVLEDGAVVFDLAMARYSVSGEHNKCLLHLWSAERNVVRRVLQAQTRADVLQLAVQRLGQVRPTKLEICRRRDRRTPTAKKMARSAYQQKLRLVLERQFPAFTIAQLSSAMDLERSFGPIYVRGVLRRGQSAFAVLGVNGDETQSSIDAALTFAVLWLDTCRHAQDGVLVEGINLFLPARSSALTAERLMYLNRDAAKWKLYEFDEQEDAVVEIDCADRGNIATRLVHCPEAGLARERFADSIHQVQELLPQAEVAVLSPAEIAFRLHGLEFARARVAHDPTSFRSGQEIVFGVGAEERVLCEANHERFADLLRRAAAIRHTAGPKHHPVWRMHPERWLESLVLKNVEALDERLDGSCLYSQVPAFSAADRAMIDVLTTTRQGRLAVLELKADEDIHLPLQGLDYWSRVQWHHARGEFQTFGYFPGRELSPEPPVLLLVAPTLRVHPATDTLLRYLSPDVDWTLIGIGESWRDNLRVIFRKRRDSLFATSSPRSSAAD